MAGLVYSSIFTPVQRGRMPNERTRSAEGDKYVAQLPRGPTPVNMLFLGPVDLPSEMKDEIN